MAENKEKAAPVLQPKVGGPGKRPPRKHVVATGEDPDEIRVRREGGHLIIEGERRISPAEAQTIKEIEAHLKNHPEKFGRSS